MRVGIVGGGAAGFFAAIHVSENYPGAEVFIFEKSKKLLSKVKVSGGGRCNVTNGCNSLSDLARAYPRGGKRLKKAFSVFNNKQVMDWFESKGVPLVVQDDGCVFPVSQNSQSIIDCFLKETSRLGVQIFIESSVSKLIPHEEKDQIELFFSKGGVKDKAFDKVIIATGGSPKRVGLEWLENLGHKISDPVPSLFTFNMPNENVTELMGIVVEETITKIQGTKLKSNGPLLITHWGMSGPSILKLSAFGARILSDLNYKFIVQVNWVNVQDMNVVLFEIEKIIKEHYGKQLGSIRPYYIPDRLWRYLLEKSQLGVSKKWNELGKKGVNKLLNVLTNDTYQVEGKTTFKEEFVTCGGVNLESVDFKTMESRTCKNLYFTGELLDIDGITGGYNFQAAWTTAYIAAQLKSNFSNNEYS